MRVRPLTLALGAALLVLIGASGLMVGIGLVLSAVQNRTGLAEVQRAGFVTGAVFSLYSAPALLAGVGLLLGRRWGWWLGLADLLVGLAILGYTLTLVDGLDPILMFGLVLWLITVGLLLAPATRAALRR